VTFSEICISAVNLKRSKEIVLLTPPIEFYLRFYVIEKETSLDYSFLNEKNREVYKKMAEIVIGEWNSFESDSVLLRIMEIFEMKVELAFDAFRIMIQIGVIEKILGKDLYFMAGSAPF
jgi:hypothetical protein